MMVAVIAYCSTKFLVLVLRQKWQDLSLRYLDQKVNKWSVMLFSCLNFLTLNELG